MRFGMAVASVVALLAWAIVASCQAEGREAERMAALGLRKECHVTSYMPTWIGKTMIMQPVYSCEWVPIR